MKKLYSISFLFIALTSFAQRPITPSDIYKIQSVSDPQISPDGKWVAYVLSAPDSISMVCVLTDHNNKLDDFGL